MSERTDNTDLEDEMTRTTELQIDERDGDRFVGADPTEELEALPPRPRNRLFAPLPLALIVVLIAACGFLGGVLVQKGSEGGGSAAGLPGGLPSFLNKEGGKGSGSEGSGGLPAGFSGGNSSAAVSGTVSSVSGRTIYVKDSEGSTVAVRVEDGSKVSRDSNVGVKKIHPGDSVVVQGAKHGSTVKASSIAATESGVETSAAAGLPVPGGSESGGEGSGSVELFGE
ncbi:MAG TPA: hypothetical protein VII45_04445 [Solirubrobacterales bacterium]